PRWRGPGPANGPSGGAASAASRRPTASSSAPVADQPAVEDIDDVRRAFGDGAVMGREHDDQVGVVPPDLIDQVEDAGRRGSVELARLVRGPGDARTPRPG